MTQKEYSSYELLYMLAMLEHSMHRKYVGEYSVSKDFDASDVWSINKEACKMLLFAGLLGYHPCIEFAEIGSNKVGDIEINQNSLESNLYIRFAHKTLGNRDMILSVMAHEICHKVLQRFRFPILSGVENEYYTDLATIYIGFGKLTLDGHTSVSMDGSRVTTTNLGYLSYDTIHRAYLIAEAAYTRHSTLTILDKELKQVIEDILRASAEENIAYFEKLYTILCPFCGYRSHKYTPELLNKIVKCPNCRKEFQFIK